MESPNTEKGVKLIDLAGLTHILIDKLRDDGNGLVVFTLGNNVHRLAKIGTGVIDANGKSHKFTVATLDPAPLDLQFHESPPKQEAEAPKAAMTSGKSE